MNRRLAWALALLATGCKCGSQGGGGGGGDGLVGVQGIGQASNLDFGDVLVGQSANLDLELNNSGGDPLTVTAVDLTGVNASDFTLASAAPRAPIAPGTTVAIPLTFTPGGAGSRSGTITLETDSAATPKVTVQLAGTGVEVGFSAAPDPLAFGSVQLGAPAPTQTLVFSNAGNLNLTVTLGALTGAQASLFTVQGGGGPLAPAGSQNVSVTFTPTGVGAAAATLPLQVCATGAGAALGCGAASIPLTATAVDSLLSFNPNPLTFGMVPAGNHSQLALTLSNLGSADVTLTQLVTQSGSTAVFALQALPATFPATPIALPAGQSLQLTVQYTPSGSVSGDTDTLVASYTDSGLVSRTATLPLYGNVVLTPCALNLVPTSLAFNTVQVGLLATANLALDDSGQASCQISSVALAASSDPDFSLSPGTPSSFSVPGLGSVQLSVDFLAATAQPPLLRTGTLGFQSTDPSLPNLTVPLSAELDSADFPCTLTVQPPSLAFGTVAANIPSLLQVTVANTGVSVCTVTAIALSTATSAYFTLAAPSQMSLTLNAGASATIGVNFQGPAVAPLAHTGDLLFQTSDQTQPNVDVPLTATVGAPCQLTIAPGSLNYGTVDAGSPETLDVTVTNGSLASCQVSGIALSAKTDPDFTLGTPSQTSLTLAPGTQGTIGVVFDAASAKSPFTHSGDLLFATTDQAHASVDVPLFGQVQNNTPYSAGWPKWHNDNTDEGQSEADTSGLAGAVAWRFNVGIPTGTYINAPVIGADGTIYQVANSGTVYAISAAGVEEWGTVLPSPSSDIHPATPILAKDGSLFLQTGGEGGSLYHLAADGGAVIGTPTAPLPGSDGFDVCPSLTNVAPSLLLDGDDEGPTAAFSLASGLVTLAHSLNVPYGFPDAERVSVAVGPDDTSYWCSINFCEAVSSPVAGFQPLSTWPGTAGQGVGSIQPAPDAPAGEAEAISDLALDLGTTGNLMIIVGWSPDGVNGQIELVSVNPANGKNNWKLLLPQGLLPSSSIYNGDVGNSAPAVATDGTVYLGSLDGLYAVSGTTGVVKAGFPFSAADVDTAPAIGGDGTIFIGAEDGNFYAVNPNGTQRFKITTGGRITSSPAIGPDGTVVFVSDDGYLYKIK